MKPERKASRCVVYPAVLVRDNLMPDIRARPALARVAGAGHFPNCPQLRGRSHRRGSWETARGRSFGAPIRRPTARLRAEETPSMTIDVATGISRILKQEGVGWVSTFPVCRVNNAFGREGMPMLMMRDDRYAVAVADAFSRIMAGAQEGSEGGSPGGNSRIGVCTFQGGVN